jgi:energy-coupling factor transport system permease protein
MFAYIEQNSFLHRLNPLTKLAVILFLTILLSLSLHPLFPSVTLVISLAAICLLGRFSLRHILKRARLFLFLGMSFMLFMLFFQGLKDADAPVKLFFLSYHWEGLLSVLALGIRIIVFAVMSLGFVLTTSPNDLVLSLMLQLKLSPVHGYAALAAYRFLPSLQSETLRIKLAQEIRGVPTKGLANRLASPFRLFVPLFCQAARRGERVAMAMESRGLGGRKGRTFYKQTTFRMDDVVFVIGTVLLFGAVAGTIAYLGMFHFSFGFESHRI